ncbi:hypothetical protein ACROSR_18395 [Roseovarius tibetensis]|uniref:hypothetical protein n=1 Tax=Roseovarius tibetensis TaxID=2685897 RepID=UPI003D7F9068
MFRGLRHQQQQHEHVATKRWMSSGHERPWLEDHLAQSAQGALLVLCAVTHQILRWTQPVSGTASQVTFLLAIAQQRSKEQHAAPVSMGFSLCRGDMIVLTGR